MYFYCIKTYHEESNCPWCFDITVWFTMKTYFNFYNSKLSVQSNKTIYWKTIYNNSFWTSTKDLWAKSARRRIIKQEQTDSPCVWACAPEYNWSPPSPDLPHSTPSPEAVGSPRYTPSTGFPGKPTKIKHKTHKLQCTFWIYSIFKIPQLISMFIRIENNRGVSRSKPHSFLYYLLFLAITNFSTDIFK